MKRVILTGGGTGGHCLPIQVMFNSLSQKKIECYIVTDQRGKSFFHSIDRDKVITIWQPIETNRRTLRQTLVNKSRKSRYKSAIKKINLLIEKKDKKAALGYLPKLNSELMKIAKTGVIKKQNASRNVSRITKRINSL